MPIALLLRIFSGTGHSWVQGITEHCFGNNLTDSIKDELDLDQARVERGIEERDVIVELLPV
jgi:hypothetical protein